MHYRLRKLGVIVVLVVALWALAWAQAPAPATGVFVAAPTASSTLNCSVTPVGPAQATVQTAVNAATNGSTVRVASGSATWTPPGITITGGKYVILAGAAACGAGTTTISGGMVSMTASVAPVQGASLGTRVTGFTFNLQSGAQIQITASRGWRIDHNTINIGGWAICWYTIGNQGVRSTYGNEGLIDHNTMTNCRFVNYGEDGDGFGGSDRWLETDTVGTYHTIFLEDNSYAVTNCTQPGAGVLCNFADANYGGSYVARFNTLQDTYFEGHPTSGGVRGARFYEVYGNTISLPNYAGGSNFCHWGTFHSGEGFVWGNTAVNDCSPTDEPNRWDLTWNDGDLRGAMGSCNGSNYVDSNETAAGWLCRDQPGAGKDASYWRFSMGAPASVQAKRPLYMWNNTAPSGRWIFDSCDSGPGTSCDEPRIVHDRDFFQPATGVQTTSSSPFNGTTGTGWGIIARRPTTCTTGVGYWATDEGEWNSTNGATPDGRLYQCSSTNTWTLYYTPFPYPHYLQGL